MSKKQGVRSLSWGLMEDNLAFVIRGLMRRNATFVWAVLVCLSITVLARSPQSEASVPLAGLENSFATFVGPTVATSSTTGQFGTDMANIGDQDGDGKADFIVGQPFFSLGGGSPEGAAFVVFSSGMAKAGTYELSTLSSTLYGSNKVFRITGDDPGDRLGYSVASVADMSDDGKNEILIGAPGDGLNQRGAAQLIYSQALASESSAGTRTVAGIMSTANNGYTIIGDGGVAADPVGHIGLSVGSTNSMNGTSGDNGAPELLVGDPSSAGGQNGKVAVVWGVKRGAAASCLTGSPQTITLNVGWETGGTGNCGFEVHGTTPPGGTGAQVARVGDVGGPGGPQDGVEDFAVSDPNASFLGSDGVTRNNAGVVYIIWGKSTTTAVDLGAFTPLQGYRIGGAGIGGELTGNVETNPSRPGLMQRLSDINGDGIFELMVGDPKIDLPGKSRAGNAYVVFLEKSRDLLAKADVDLLKAPGEGTGAGSWSGLGIAGPVADGAFGYVSAAGEMNGDGIDDLVIGAPGTIGSNGVATGAAYVVFGKRTSEQIDLERTASTWGWRIDGGSITGSRLGVSAIGVGDWDGDGLGDVALGDPQADFSPSNNQGLVYVVSKRPIPSVTTTAAANITSTSASLTGLVNPATFGAVDASFQLMTSDNQLILETTKQTVPNGTGAITTSSDIVNLTPCTTYRFRILGTNTDGYSATGSDESFTTLCGSGTTGTGTTTVAEAASCADYLVAANGKSVSKYVSFAGTKARLEGPTGGYAYTGSKLTFQLAFSKLAGESKVKQAVFYLDGTKIGSAVKKPIFGVTFKTKGLSSTPDAGTKHTVKVVAKTKGKKGKSKSFSLSWKLSDCKRARYSVSVKAAKKKNGSRVDLTTTLDGVGAVLTSATEKLSKYVKISPKAGKKVGTAKLTVSGKSKTLTLKTGKTVKKSAKSISLYNSGGTKISLKKSKGIWSLSVSGLPTGTTKLVAALRGKTTGFVTLSKYCSTGSFAATAKGGSKGNSVKLSTTSTRSCKSKKK